MKIGSTILLLFFQLSLFSQTNVSGTISTNTTWTLANSPYHVIGDVLVDSAVTLTINPGVVVELDSNKTIQSHGTMVAIGTENQKIVFTSFGTGPNLGLWNSIELLSANATYNSNGIYQSGDILKHVDISFGKVVVDGSIHVESSTIERSDGIGLSLIHEDSLQLAPVSKILKTKISDHLGEGIRVWSHYFLIDSCEIRNNKRGILFSYISNSYLARGNVSNCKITDHISHGIHNSLEGDFSSIDSIFIRNNIIVNNSGYGIYHNGNGFVWVKRNIINSNEGGIYFYGLGHIDSNIVANSQNGYPMIINYLGAGYKRVRNNSICFNHAASNGSCGIFFNIRTIMEYNTITQNIKDPVGSFNGEGTLTKFGHYRYIHDRAHFNNIFNNNSPYEFKIDATFNYQTQDNYWGTTRDTCIAEKVYDRADAGTGTGIVDYSSHLNSPNTSSPISPPSLVGKELSPLGHLMLYWKPNPESDVAGYKIYWSNPTGYSFDTMVDVGNTDHFILKGISDTNATYAITAYDNQADGFDDMLEGHESWFSPAAPLHQNDVIRMNRCENIISPSGRLWTQTGMYFDTVQPIAICDDIRAYFVLIGAENSSIQNIQSCGNYTSPSGNHLWTTPGTYIDTILNSGGCDSILTINLSILASSQGTLDTTICRSMVSPSGKYTWSLAGFYNDTLVNQVGCDSIITVQVRNSFNKILQNSNGVLVTNNTGVSYQWLDCNNGFAIITGAIGSNYYPTVNGSYALTVNDGFCSDTTDCIIVADVGLKNKTLAQKIQYYPNPTKGKITVDLGSTFSEINIEVFSSSGKSTLRKRVFGVQEFEIDLEGAKGYYTLKIEARVGDRIEKVELKVLKD